MSFSSQFASGIESEIKQLYIVSDQNGYYFDLENVNAGNGTKVVLQPHKNKDTQKWIFNSDGSIVSVHCGKVLDAQGGFVKGNAITIYPHHGGPNQRWKVAADGTIRTADGEFAIDIKEGSDDKGAHLHLWPPHGKLNQKWHLEPVKLESPEPVVLSANVKQSITIPTEISTGSSTNIPANFCTPVFGQQIPASMFVFIKGFNGKYLSHGKNNKACQSTEPDYWEVQFYVERPGCFHLKNIATNRYLTAEKILGSVGKTNLNRVEAHMWEQFHFEYGNPGYFYAKSDHNKYLTFDKNGEKVKADASKPGINESFCMISK